MQPTADANPQFGQACDPGGISGDIADLAALTGQEQFQRQEIGRHGEVTSEGEIY
jgi:hypothetical protein